MWWLRTCPYGASCGLGEGLVLGVVGAVAPLPAPLLVPAAALALGVIEIARKTSERVARAGVRLATGVAVVALATAVPWKPLDERVAIASPSTVGDALDALETCERLQVRRPEVLRREVRLDLPGRPPAREVLDAIAAATGLTWRSTGCATGATALRGMDGVAVQFR